MEKTFNFKETVVEILSATGFFYKNKFEAENPECLKRNSCDFIRALAFVELVSKPNDEKYKNDLQTKYIGTRTLKDIKYKYQDFLEPVLDAGIVFKETSGFHAASRYWLNPIYAGTSRFVIDEREEEIYKGIFKKSFDRGQKATTDKPIRVNILKNDFERLMLASGKDADTIERQWKVIEDINRTGRLNPTRKRESRLYSRLTSLSKVIHPYLTINGKSVCEIDQHATYFTLIPQVVRSITLKSKNLKLEQELIELEHFIETTEDIYQEISKDVPLSREEIKANVVSWLCDQTTYMNPLKSKIREWFLSRFPHTNKILDSLRNSNAYPYKAMNLESKIFINAASYLKESGVDVVTKHDCLLFHQENQLIVTETLKHHFSINNVPFKCKSVAYGTPTVFSDDTLFCADLLKNHPLKKEEREEYQIEYMGDFCLQSAQLNLKRPKIRVLKDGRFTVSIKNKNFNSRKNETEEQFLERLEQEKIYETAKQPKVLPKNEENTMENKIVEKTPMDYTKEELIEVLKKDPNFAFRYIVKCEEEEYLQQQQKRKAV